MRTEEQAIGDILKRLEVTWNASDSKRFAESFADDAHFIQIFGGQLDGRHAIEASHRHIFETIYKGSRATFSLRSVRHVRPDVAIVLAQAHLEFSEGNEACGIDTRPTLIMVKQQGKWQIVAFQNTRISQIPAAVEAWGAGKIVRGFHPD